ncbi:hypothetical protein BDW22DRAFT_1359150 [Trametopsis cervina]|nr:hypothetical protein BDW22DRAFT_1359150 [Trametopsis cervina]
MPSMRVKILYALLALTASAYAINEFPTIGQAPSSQRFIQLHISTISTSERTKTSRMWQLRHCSSGRMAIKQAFTPGTASAGQRFDVESTSSAGFHFGRYRGTSNWCTWILPSVIVDSPHCTSPNTADQPSCRH